MLWVVFVFVFVFSVVRCRVFNWHSTDEKVEAHPKPVGEANEFICTPTAAAVDFCVEGRVRDAQLVCCLSAGQLIDEEQVVDALRNKFVAAIWVGVAAHVVTRFRLAWPRALILAH